MEIHARSVIWTAWPGSVAGMTAATASLALAGLSEPDWRWLVPYLVIGLIYGFSIGAVVGLAIGLPVVALVAAVRRRSEHWRGGGALAAAGVSGLVLAGMFGRDSGDALDLGLTIGVVAGLAAGSAWWGLGRIFEPRAA